MNRTSKGFSHLILIFSIVAVGLAGIIYYSVQKGYLHLNPSSKTISSTVAPTTAPDVTANWKTYTNSTYGYSVKYPGDWTVSEKTDFKAIALMTTTFASPDGNSLFDIWVREGKWQQVEDELLSKKYTERKINNFTTLVSPNKPDTYTLQTSRKKSGVLQGKQV